MADNNDDVLSVNSDFERIPNTPLERDTDVEDVLEEGQKTPKGFAASEPSIDPVVAALMKKMDVLDVKVDGLSHENSELRVQNVELGKQNSELRTHLSVFKHNNEHEDAEFLLVDNSENAFWDSSVSFLAVRNFTVENEGEGVSIRSTKGFPTVPHFTDTLVYNVNNYEVAIDKIPPAGNIHAGFATRDFLMGEWVGKTHHSFAITNDGTLWLLGEETTNFAPGGFSVGDTVGLIIAVGSKTATAEDVNCRRCLEKPCWLMFTKNGKIWGTPIPLPSNLPFTFFPTVSLGVGCKVTANFGASSFKYAPSTAGLNCFGGFCHCGWLNNELEKIRVQQKSDRSELKDETNNSLIVLHAQMAEQEARFQLKLDAMQSKHDGELEGLRRRIIALTLASLQEHEPLEFLKHFKPEFLELILVNNTENAAWNLVDNWFSVSGNSVTKNGDSWRSIRSKRGFSTGPITISGIFDPTKVQLIFNYFEVTIDIVESDMVIGLAPDHHPMDKWVGNYANSFGISKGGSFLQSAGASKKLAPDGFTQGDTIGCGLMAIRLEAIQKLRWIFFTKNGKICGTPVELPLDVPSMLYPAVSIYYSGNRVTANFGNEPFKYGIPPAAGLLC